MSDVPFGVFLSGGLDSSTNVALMAELTDKPVRTYSVAPRGHERYDELKYARIVAERFGTDHHEVVIDEDDMREFIPQMVVSPGRAARRLDQHPPALRLQARARDGHDRRAGRRGRRRALPRLQGYVDHRRYVVPFQRAVPRALRKPIGRGAVAVTTRLGRGVRHGEALYDAGRQPDPVLGRGALLPRSAQARDRRERPSPRLLPRAWSGSGTRRAGSSRAPTSSSG